MLWQSSRYNSLRFDPRDLAIESILEEVRKEHWLRFKDCNAGAEDTSAARPMSERRQAPLRDNDFRTGKLFDDRAKVDNRT